MEEKYEIAFKLISYAGDARSEYMLAMDAVREMDFEKAKQMIAEADALMYKAHEFQTQMIQQEAEGKPVDINIILVHAQDHMTMAILSKDHVTELMHIYSVLQGLKERFDMMDIK